MAVRLHSEVFDALIQSNAEFEKLARHLAEAIPMLKVESFLEKAAQISSRASRPFVLGIMGEFRSGKSSLINALVEQDIALVDEIETTATLNHYRFAETEQASIGYKNGETDNFTLQKLHDVLDTNRYNTEWLEELKNAEVTFGVPLPYLKRIELWDSPGFGGSDFNEQTAAAFLERVDAVVWVFNRNMLGKAALLDALGELRRRGKHIIGVINKCELDSESEIQRYQEEIKRKYSTIQFSEIVALSSKMAREQQRKPVPESPYPGDLPPDGGISYLREVLDQQVAGKERQEMLAASAAAGDLAATIQKLTDDTRGHFYDAKRRLDILEQQKHDYDDSISERFARLADELSDDYVYELRGYLRRTFETRINGASEEELREQNWYESIYSTICSKEEFGAFAKRFSQRLPERVKEVANEIDSDVWEKIRSDMTPAEKETYVSVALSENNIPELSELPVEIAYNQEGAVRGGILGAVFGIVADIILPGSGLLFTIFSTAAGAAVGASSDLTVSRRNLSRAEISSRISRRANEDIERLADELRPKVHREWFVPKLDDVSKQITPILLAEQRVIILRGATEETLQRIVKIFEPNISNLEALIQHLHTFTEAAKPDPDIVECSISPNDRDRAQRIIKAVFKEATTQLAIVDGQLSPDAIPSLLLASKDTPISILTWDSVLSSIRFGDFREQIIDLRNRGYSVNVLSPKQREGGKAEPLPEGCWIFTDRGSYHLSKSLGVLLNGEGKVKFVPYTDDGKIRSKNFERWWKDRVPGYSVIKSV